MAWGLQFKSKIKKYIFYCYFWQVRMKKFPSANHKHIHVLLNITSIFWWHCFFQIGGMKAGCFDNYPSHSNDPYVVKKSKGGDGSEKRIFRPSQGPKSTPTRSIINQNVERRINNLNFRQPVTVSIWCDTRAYFKLKKKKKRSFIIARKCQKMVQQTRQSYY